MQSIKLTELAKTVGIETERAEFHSSVVFLEVKNAHLHTVCVSQVSFA